MRPIPRSPRPQWPEVESCAPAAAATTALTTSTTTASSTAAALPSWPWWSNPGEALTFESQLAAY